MEELGETDKSAQGSKMRPNPAVEDLPLRDGEHIGYQHRAAQIFGQEGPGVAPLSLLLGKTGYTYTSGGGKKKNPEKPYASLHELTLEIGG